MSPPSTNPSVAHGQHCGNRATGAHGRTPQGRGPVPGVFRAGGRPKAGWGTPELDLRAYGLLATLGRGMESDEGGISVRRLGKRAGLDTDAAKVYIQPMILPFALVALVASCVVELPRDAGGRGDDRSDSSRVESPAAGTSTPQGSVDTGRGPPGHGGPNPGQGPGGAGPPGQDKDKGKGKDK